MIFLQAGVTTSTNVDIWFVSIHSYMCSKPYSLVRDVDHLSAWNQVIKEKTFQAPKYLSWEILLRRVKQTNRNSNIFAFLFLF